MPTEVRFDPAARFAGASALRLDAQAGRPSCRAARAQGVRHVVPRSSAVIAEGADETHPVRVLHATSSGRRRSARATPSTASARGPYHARTLLERLLRTFTFAVGTAPEDTDTVEKPTRTPASPFTGWARDHAADFGGRA